MWEWGSSGESGRIVDRWAKNGGQKKADVSRFSIVNVETPPLEINLLCKASSYARKIFQRQLFKRDHVVKYSLGEKLQILSFPRFVKVGILGESFIPKNPPPPDGSSTYARDDFQNLAKAIAMPHVKRWVSGHR